MLNLIYCRNDAIMTSRATKYSILKDKKISRKNRKNYSEIKKVIYKI